jgi:hypothetical protein
MGLFLLVVIRFLPLGLGSLWIKRKNKQSATKEGEKS